MKSYDDDDNYYYYYRTMDMRNNLEFVFSSTSQYLLNWKTVSVKSIQI